MYNTVNSVPRFENAWMERSKFPYTARSSALTIRHAVGIDERRAKVRLYQSGDETCTEDSIVSSRSHQRRQDR